MGGVNDIENTPYAQDKSATRINQVTGHGRQVIEGEPHAPWLEQVGFSFIFNYGSS